jgi:predicted small lipoprotein YifL
MDDGGRHLPCRKTSRPFLGRSHYHPFLQNHLMRNLSAILPLILLLYGCGLKGPLYLPEENLPPPSAPTQNEESTG